MVSTIVFPSKISTYQEKLFTIWKVKKLCRDARNEMAAKARNDPEKYIKSGIYKAYTRAYEAKLREILSLQSFLISKVWGSQFSLDERKHFSQDDYFKYENELLLGGKGSKKYWEDLPLSSSVEVPPLDEINALDLDKISSAEPLLDPTEDLTTYTEEDTDGNLTVTSSKVSFDHTTSPVDETRLYKNKGTDHFNGDFEHYVQCYLDVATDAYYPCIWALADTVRTTLDWTGNNEYALSAWWYPTPRIYLEETSGGSTTRDLADVSVDTLYYCRIVRDENVGTYGTLYLHIATGDYDDNGGSSVDDLSVTLTSKEDLDIIFAYNLGSASDNSVGYNQNLDIGEAGAQNISAPALAMSQISVAPTLAGSGTANIQAPASSQSIASVVASLTGSGVAEILAPSEAMAMAEVVASLVGSGVASISAPAISQAFVVVVAGVGNLGVIEIPAPVLSQGITTVAGEIATTSGYMAGIRFIWVWPTVQFVNKPVGIDFEMKTGDISTVDREITVKDGN